jgi:hypothetical protein
MQFANRVLEPMNIRVSNLADQLSDGTLLLFMLGEWPAEALVVRSLASMLQGCSTIAFCICRILISCRKPRSKRFVCPCLLYEWASFVAVPDRQCDTVFGLV